MIENEHEISARLVALNNKGRKMKKDVAVIGCSGKGSAAQGREFRHMPDMVRSKANEILLLAHWSKGIAGIDWMEF
jgi:hypothetical protein